MYLYSRQTLCLLFVTREKTIRRWFGVFLGRCKWLRSMTRCARDWLLSLKCQHVTGCWEISSSTGCWAKIDQNTPLGNFLEWPSSCDNPCDRLNSSWAPNFCLFCFLKVGVVLLTPKQGRSHHLKAVSSTLVNENDVIVLKTLKTLKVSFAVLEFLRVYLTTWAKKKLLSSTFHAWKVSLFLLVKWLSSCYSFFSCQSFLHWEFSK